MVCVVGKMRDLILQLSKSSIYSTKPKLRLGFTVRQIQIHFNVFFVKGLIFLGLNSVLSYVGVTGEYIDSYVRAWLIIDIKLCSQNCKHLSSLPI